MQCSAAIYADGSAVLTIGGNKRKIRATTIDAARTAVMKIIMAEAAAHNEDCVLTALEEGGTSTFRVHADGTLEASTQQPAYQPAHSSASIPAADPEPVIESPPTITPPPADRATTEKIPSINEVRQESQPSDVAITNIDWLHLVHSPRVKYVVLTLLAIALVAVAGLGGTRWWTQHTHADAANQCISAQQAAKQALTKLDAEKASTQGITQTPTDQVTNQDSITTLQASWAKTLPYPSLSCSTSLSTSELNAHSATYNQTRQQAATLTQTISEQASTVTRQSTEKRNADARTHLAQQLDAAQALYDGSVGTVADESTRDNLNALLTPSHQLLEQNKQPDTATLNAQANKLTSAMDAVKASQQAKAAADTAAAQPNPAPAPTPAPSSKGTGKSGRTPSAPQHSSAPRTNNGGGTTSGGGSAPSWSVPPATSDEGGGMGDNDPGL